jgi:branched-subunit amino acid ABC-type transport system permease component
MTWETLLQPLIYGLQIGVTFMLLALGLTVIFSIMNVINLAHGEFYMLGAFTVFYIAVGGSANVFGPILSALVLNILSEVLRSVREFEPIVFALILIGAVLLLQCGLIGLVQRLWRWIHEITDRAFERAM